MNRTTKPNSNRRWGILALLVLMTASLRFLFADIACTSGTWACNEASASIGGASAYMKYCPPYSSPQTSVPVYFTSKCGIIEGSGTATGASIYTVSDPGGGCHKAANQIEGTVDIKADSLEAEDIQKTRTGCGTWTFKIIGPKKSGMVTVTAKVQGDCLIDQFAEPTCDPNKETHTYTAVAQIYVVVTDCSSCSAKSSAASGTDDNHSVDFQWNLGALSPDSGAGIISLYAETPSTDLAKPLMLNAYAQTGVEVLPGLDGALRQVNAPQMLVNVATVNAYEYHLECYYASDVGAKDIDGFYTTGSASPFATWVVKNPDGASAYNRLWITEQRGGEERTFKYTYTSANYQWDLLKPDGVTTLSTWRVRDTSDSSGDTTNYFRQVSVGSQILSRNQKTYKYFSVMDGKLLTQEIEGTGSATRTTSYTYYPFGLADGSDGLIKRIDYPTGNWVYYKYDSMGRKVIEYAAYGNSAPPSIGTEPDALVDHCKKTTYAYTLNMSEDGHPDDSGDPNDPASVRRTIVSIPVLNGSTWELHEISRTYTMGDYASGTMETRVCANPGDHWDTVGDVITISQTDPSSYKPLYTSRPDLTSTTYTYSGYTTYEDDKDSSGNIITETTTTTDEFGNPLSRTKTDYATGVILERETYNYIDSTTMDYIDPLRRSYDVTDLAGRTTQVRYNTCCGMDHMVDPDNVTTQYTYDSVKNLIASTALGVIQTNVYDGLRRVVVTGRMDVNGALLVSDQKLYDVLSQLMLETNAFGGVTFTTNVIVNNQLITTNIYPDGGIRITTYCRDGRVQSITGSAVSGVQYQYGIALDGSIWREYKLETKLNASGSATPEWTTNFVDGAGRTYKILYPVASGSNPNSQSFYNKFGQLTKKQDPDGMVTLYQYNSKGEREYTATDVNPANTTIDSNLNYPIDFANDRVTRTVRTVLTDTDPDNSRGVNIIRTDSYVWPTAGVNSSLLVSRSEVATTSLQSWQVAYKDASNPSTAVTTSRSTTLANSGNSWTRTQTATQPNGSTSVSSYQNGRLQSTVQQGSSGSPTLQSVTCQYDSFGRIQKQVDARNGATIYAYVGDDQLSSLTTPAPGNGQSPQTTFTYYNVLGQVTNIVQPDGGSITNQYFLTGSLKKTWGARTYPVEYTYDYAGRMATMKTWTNFASNLGAVTTTWYYDVYRGFLTNKVYADNNGPVYTYTAGGRLKTRTWARVGTGSQKVKTTYTYGFDDGTSGNDYGDLVGIAYANDPASTAGVTLSYDRRGRRSQTVQGSMTTSWTYNDPNEILTESYSGGSLNGLSISNRYDNFLRRTNLTALNGSAVLASDTYSYDTASRFQTISDGTQSATYSYIPSSSLVNQILFKQGTTTRLTTTKSYDYLNRLTGAASVNPGGATVSSFGYLYNDADQRIRTTLADGSYWLYDYDKLGQVTSGIRYWADGTPVAGQQFGYRFDDIGNRRQTTAGGDENGANLRTANYTVNNLNQFGQRDVPGAVDVMGMALASETVSVNSSSPYRKGEYFRKEVSVANGSSAVWQGITVTATGETTVTGNNFVPKTAELFTYDLDGNLTSDGRWNYTWDAENRLIRLVANTSVGPQQRIDFEYDFRGRRIGKKVWNNTSGTGSPVTALEFLYDGWNLLTELDNGSALVRSYLWGRDLSGSIQGAGGVGGLLAIHSSSATQFTSYDGNGNVTTLVDASNSTVTGQYEYGPFGETIRQTGSAAPSNPFRFSTKYVDNETDLSYYGYRYYNSSTGRWLGRDPIGEAGGENVYAFLRNSGLNGIDYLGLEDFPYPDPDNDPTPGAPIATISITATSDKLCNAASDGKITIRVAATVVWDNFDKVASTRGEVQIDGNTYQFNPPDYNAPDSHSSAIEVVIPRPACPVGPQSGKGTILIIDKTRRNRGRSGVAQKYEYEWSYECEKTLKKLYGGSQGPTFICTCSVKAPFKFKVTQLGSNTVYPNL